MTCNKLSAIGCLYHLSLITSKNIHFSKFISLFSYTGVARGGTMHAHPIKLYHFWPMAWVSLTKNVINQLIMGIFCSGFQYKKEKMTLNVVIA